MIISINYIDCIMLLVIILRRDDGMIGETSRKLEI